MDLTTNITTKYGLFVVHVFLKNHCLRCLIFCSIENFKSDQFFAQHSKKKILKINFYANLNASSSNHFFHIESILRQFLGKEIG